MLSVDDIESLRLNPPEKIVKEYNHIWGPIPIAWIGRAACLPGRVLHVALALWHISTLSRNRSIKMQRKIRMALGISQRVYSQGLSKLQEIGLVSVEKQEGCTPVVTLLGIEEEQDYPV
jgi:hypothetical protein